MMTFFNTAFHNVVRTIMTVFNTAKNPAKNSVTSAAMEDELKQAFPSITRAWLEEVNKVKLQNQSGNQLSVITFFPTNQGLEVPNVA